MIGGKSKFFLEHFQRRGCSECLHAENRSVNAHVAAPSEGGCLLHRYASLDGWGQNGAAVFFALPLEQFPRRHADNARANTLLGELLVSLNTQGDFAPGRHEQYLWV